jgi:molybdopterin-synthase adenylyltransferase
MPAQRPRLTMTGPLLRGSGELHIVGSREVLTIPDPDGAMQRLLRLADGSRSRAELVAALAIDHPLLGEQDVEDALVELEAAGLVEDAAPRGRILSSRVSRRDVHERSLFGGPARAL